MVRARCGATPPSVNVSRASRWCSASMSTVVRMPSGRIPRSSQSPETPVPVPTSTTARASMTEPGSAAPPRRPRRSPSRPPRPHGRAPPRAPRPRPRNPRRRTSWRTWVEQRTWRSRPSGSGAARAVRSPINRDTATLSRSGPRATASRGRAPAPSGARSGRTTGTPGALPFVGAGDVLRTFTCCEGRFSQVALRRGAERTRRQHCSGHRRADASRRSSWTWVRSSRRRRLVRTSAAFPPGRRSSTGTPTASIASPCA